MRYRLQRILSLFLAVVLICTAVPYTAFARDPLVGGVGTNKKKSTAGNSDWSSQKNGSIGLAIGLQFMTGSKYKVTYEEKAGTDEQPFATGVAEVAMHFLSNYPVAYCKGSDNDFFYVLPTKDTLGNSYDPYKFLYNSSATAAVPLNNLHYIRTDNTALPSSVSLADALWEAAIKHCDEENPSPRISSSDFKQVLSSLTVEEAKNLVAGIYSPRRRQYAAGACVWNEPNVTEINERFKTYLELGTEPYVDSMGLSNARSMCNYAALIASVAKVAYGSDTESWKYAIKQLEQFLCGSLEGKEFSPIVIVTEAAVAFEQDGDKKVRVWRTATDSVATMFNLPSTDKLGQFGSITDDNCSSYVRNIANDNYSAYTNDAGLHNPATAMFMALSQNNRWNTDSGGVRILGLTKYGQKVEAYNRTTYGRMVSSIDNATIDNAAKSLGISVSADTGPWGVGIYGIGISFMVDPPPSTKVSAEVFPTGVVGISPDKTFVVDPGGYNIGAEVTVKLSLDASGYYTDPNSNDPAPFNSFADTLRWMQQVGAPYPCIRLYVKQAAAIPSTRGGDSYYAALKNGYYKPVANDTLNLEGGKLTWTDIARQFTVSGLPADAGLELVDGPNNSIELKVTDYTKAIEYFNSSDIFLLLKCNASLMGSVAKGQCNEHYFKVGADIIVYGPTSKDSLDSFDKISSGLYTVYKYCRMKVMTKMEEPYIYFISSGAESYSEIKQGELPAGPSMPTEMFNTMTGAPTITDGKYYQYFTTGGKEFVLEFDGEWIAPGAESSSRTYSATFKEVRCDHPMDDPCYGHDTHREWDGYDDDGNPKYITVQLGYECHCTCSIHAVCQDPHYVGTNYVWQQKITDYSYLKINNLQIWQLLESSVDGTYELYDTDQLDATIMSVGPSAYVNHAEQSTAAEGRFIHTFKPDKFDHIEFMGNGNGTYSSNHCTVGHAYEDSYEYLNWKEMNDTVGNATNEAWCISDFIILRTTNGDQSILYYEYFCTNDQYNMTPAYINKNWQATSPVDPVAVDITFKTPQPLTYDDLWTNNAKTAAQWSPDAITWGGYSGDYTDMAGKYQSYGHSQNINLASTQVYKNAYDTYVRGILEASAYKKVPDQPWPILRLMAPNLVVTDDKQNGEYQVGRAFAFYSYLSEWTVGANLGGYDARFQGIGYSIDSPYSPNHFKVNDVVIYDPVSVSHAQVIGVDPSRDQRTESLSNVEKTSTMDEHVCPRDYTCIFSSLTCTRTGELCTEDCFIQASGTLRHICSDPHHATNYLWKLYTVGLTHTSGAICSGRSCEDVSDIIFPNGTAYAQSQLAGGHIVKHVGGSIHLSLTEDVCTYCGDSVSSVLSSAQSSERAVGSDEWRHGGTTSSCYTPCGNDALHNQSLNQDTGGTSHLTGITLLQLDWGFHVTFPNIGNFYGTGAKYSAYTSGERGWGYTNGMDTTEWTREKWIKFPFDVIFEDEVYYAGQTIYLEVPRTEFDFYIPLSTKEMAAGNVEFGAVAINTQTGSSLDCLQNEALNIYEVTYDGQRYAHNHSAHKIQPVDVVGRIGQLTIQDSGDFRYSNFFKTPLAEWYINKVVKKVDLSSQNNIVADNVDIRGITQTDTDGDGAIEDLNTYGTRTDYNATFNPFPLTPKMNNISILQKQPVRLGYKMYMDLETIGNYYGENEGYSIYKTQITPLYWHVDLATGKWTPVDVYIASGTKYVLANRFNDFTADAPNMWTASINWDEEAVRRNYTDEERRLTELVEDSYGCAIPNGTGFAYGNAQRLFLKDRNRTFIGTDTTNGVSHNPHDSIREEYFARQAQRWHFSLSLPSSSVFVKTGQACTEANINALVNNHSVIVCALDIKSRGEVWTLEYDGTSINQPFQVTGSTMIIDPVNGSGLEDPGTVLPGTDPVVAVFSIDKSSQDDLKVTGTH